MLHHKRTLISFARLAAFLYECKGLICNGFSDTGCGRNGFEAGFQGVEPNQIRNLIK
jgi:hypothetical protein